MGVVMVCVGTEDLKPSTDVCDVDSDVWRGRPNDWGRI